MFEVTQEHDNGAVTAAVSFSFTAGSATLAAFTADQLYDELVRLVGRLNVTA